MKHKTRYLVTLYGIEIFDSEDINTANEYCRLTPGSKVTKTNKRRY